MKRLVLVLIVGLLFSTSAVHCGPIHQQNPTWISALSPIFTEFSNNVIEVISEEPSEIFKEVALEDNTTNQQMNTAHNRWKNPEVVKENSYNTASSMVLFQQANIFSSGLFYGFSLMLILLNAFCFYVFREKTFLFFALGVLGLSTLFFQFDGLYNLFIFEFKHNLIFEIFSLWFFIVSLSALAHKFLSAKIKAPKSGVLSVILSSLSLLAIGFFGFFQNPLYLNVAQVLLMALLGRYLILAMQQASNNSYTKLFVVALTPFFFVLLDQLIFNYLGESLLGLSDGLFKMSAIILMLGMTYSLFYRLQVQKGENDLRQLEMRIFSRRQDAFSARVKTEKLVEDLYLENLIMQYDLDGFEIKLLQYISEGKTNAIIAKKMKTSIEEIEERTKALYEKLDIAEHVREDQALVSSQPDYLYN
ncbi:MAG: 7TM diverse intracellular signaling domain-containing protein [Flavobacteriaceae bacterium]